MKKQVYDFITRYAAVIRRLIIGLYALGYFVVVALPNSFYLSTQTGISILQQNAEYSIPILLLIVFCIYISRYYTYKTRVFYYIGHFLTLFLVLGVLFGAFLSFPYPPGIPAHLLVLCFVIYSIMWDSVNLPKVE